MADDLKIGIGFEDNFSTGLQKVREGFEATVSEMSASFRELNREIERSQESLEARYEKLSSGDKLKGFLKGALGLSKLFNKTLKIGVDDIYADYTALADDFIKGARDTVSEVYKELGITGPGEKSETGGAAALSSPPQPSVPGPSGGEYTALGVLPQGEQALLDQKKKFFDDNNKLAGRSKEEELRIDKEKWNTMLSSAGANAGAMANIMQNLYVATGKSSKGMFRVMKAFAIAETIIQTIRAAQGAYAAMSKINPVLGIAAAAAATAAGIARVNTIKNTEPEGATGTISAGGTANPPYAGGSPSAYPVPERLEAPASLQTQHITIQIYNPLSEQNWQEIAENNIIPALKDASERNIELTVVNM